MKAKEFLALVVSLSMILGLLLANGMVFAQDQVEAPAEEVPEVVEEIKEDVEAVEPEVTVEESEEEPAETVTEPEEVEETEEPADKEEAKEPVEGEPEAGEDVKEPEEETPAEGEDTETPEEVEEPAPEGGETTETPVEEEQTGEETIVPVVPQQPEGPTDPIEGKPEGSNPDGSNFGGNNSPFEPPVIVVPESPVCSCGVNEGMAHAEDCPMYEAPAQPAPVVPAVPVEGCTCETASEDPMDHSVDCPVFLATINRLPAQVKHSELYLKIMACEDYDDALDILEAADEEALAELTEKEFMEIMAYINELEPEPIPEVVIDETVIVEGEAVESEVFYVIEDGSEDYVVAPFLDPVTGKK